MQKTTQTQLRRTPEQIAEHRAIRERFQREKPTLEQLTTSGEYSDPIRGNEYWNLMQTVATLKSAREAAGLSLSDVAKLTGMDRSAINRLENGQQANPTLRTLLRYARAVGKQVVLQVSEPTAPDRRPPRRKITKP